jgi:carboxymethylenebutenolidase
VTACDKSSDVAPANETAAASENIKTTEQQDAASNAAENKAGPIAPRHAVISERLPYAEVADELVYGHFVFPADMVEPLPAVIVVHDWWGLNETVQAMADRLAAEGYIVLAVDLFGGKIATSTTEAREQTLEVVEDLERAEENIRQAYQFVDTVAEAPTVGSLGWGFGGGWALNTALLFPDDLDATVIYYGQVTSDDEELRPLDAPILGFFGAEDRAVPVDSVKAFEDALARLRKNHAMNIYPGVKDAFADPTARTYDADAAEDAWVKTLEFLGENLVVPTAE